MFVTNGYCFVYMILYHVSGSYCQNFFLQNPRRTVMKKLSECTFTGEGSVILNSVIGNGVIIGENVHITDSYIGDKVVIKDNINVEQHCIIGDEVSLKNFALRVFFLLFFSFLKF